MKDLWNDMSELQQVLCLYSLGFLVTYVAGVLFS